MIHTHTHTHTYTHHISIEGLANSYSIREVCGCVCGGGRCGMEVETYAYTWTCRSTYMYRHTEGRGGGGAMVSMPPSLRRPMIVPCTHIQVVQVCLFVPLATG